MSELIRTDTNKELKLMRFINLKHKMNYDYKSLTKNELLELFLLYYIKDRNKNKNNKILNILTNIDLK